MNNTDKNIICPHCSSTLLAFKMPDNSGYDHPFHLACFNDDCSYYLEGWEWMQQQYEVKASYRYRIDPKTGCASPLAVWSPYAIKDLILNPENEPK